jgi:hypothetical protein
LPRESTVSRRWQEVTGDDRDRDRTRCREALAPHGIAVSVDVAIKERVRIGAPVLAPPAVGVQLGDPRDVVRGGSAVAHGHCAFLPQGLTL